jgi:type I restriction enzyme S subunit
MKIKDAGRVVTGKTPVTSHKEYYEGHYLFITPNELHGNYRITTSEKTITEAGMKSIASNTIDGTSVLVGCIGWDMGNVSMCLEKCATNQQINSVTDISDMYNPYYLYYWLKNKKKYLFSIASVTRTPILSKSTFEEVEVPDIRRLEQDKIVEILLVIDKKIELNNKINDNLQYQLNLMYDYWFTQFDFPDENGLPYKSSGGKMVSTDKISYEIPSEWKVETLFKNSLAFIIKPGVDYFVTKKYLATAEVNGTDILAGTVIEYETRENRANMQPTDNSVWFAKMKNSIKHLYLNRQMQSLIDNSILSTGFCGLQCSKKSFEYIASFIEHSYFETLKDILAHGATQEAVNNDDLTGISLVIPSDRILCLYHERTAGIYAQISKNICENQELAKIRNWLLPMLMNGQVIVTD